MEISMAGARVLATLTGEGEDMAISVEERQALKMALIEVIVNQRRIFTYGPIIEFLEVLKSELSRAKAVWVSPQRAYRALTDRGRYVRALEFTVDLQLQKVLSWWVLEPLEATQLEFEESSVVLVANEHVTARVARLDDRYLFAAYLTYRDSV